VVIAVGATGLCRSDWHAWAGHDASVAVPHVPGHEFAGHIVQAGPDVHDWRAGDRVTVPFVCACGLCETCRAGEEQVCDDQFQPGFTHWGSFAEFVAVDRADTNLVRIPEEIPLDAAASLGCRLATAYRAVVTHAQAGAGQWLAVHGCGGVGLSAVMIAASRGARVVAVDVSADALGLAESLGAEAAVDATAGDTVASIREITGGGAHASVDAFGSELTCANSIRCLRKRGRHVQAGLLLGDQQSPRVPMSEVIAAELTIAGSHGMPARDYPQLLSDIATGRLQPARLIQRHVSLAEGAELLARMGLGAPAGITIIDPADSR
jgi:alcohol dehydrogenase